MTGTTVLDPVAARTRRQRVEPHLLLGGAVLVFSVALHVRDPHESGSWGGCPWLFLTGTYCPGCGGLRAVHDLTDGDWAAAASANLLLVASAPVVIVWWWRALVDKWRGVGPRLSTHRATVLVTAFGVVAVLFAVVRNTPAGSWLAP